MKYIQITRSNYWYKIQQQFRVIDEDSKVYYVLHEGFRCWVNKLDAIEFITYVNNNHPFQPWRN